MGIVQCANEQYGVLPNDPAINKHFDRDWPHSIHQSIFQVLSMAAEQHAPTAAVALSQAEKLSLEAHPIFGHRGQQLIDSLVKEAWFGE